MKQEQRLRVVPVVLAGALCLAAAPLPAQQPPEPEFAPVVKRLSDEDLPAAMRLTTFVSHADKWAASDPESFQRYLASRGLEVAAEDLQVLTALYGDFDEDQGARHTRMLHEVGDRPEVVAERSWTFALERASFTGAVLGAWLAGLRTAGQDTDAFVAALAESYSVSRSWGGRPPTMERLDQRAAAFEKSFHQEYGVALDELLQPAGPGGAR